MGLVAPVAELLCAEHKFKPIGGDILFIGKQTTYLNEGSLNFLLNHYQITPPQDFSIEIDRQTRGAGDHLITDKCLMKALGVDSLSFLDISDYEGAEIIHDMSSPIPEELSDRFDFIFNGSCLDNIFNPQVALRNMAKMLKPGGRVLSIEHGSPFNNPYTMFSPGWFADYFIANKFHDYHVYVGRFLNSTELLFGPWQWFYVNKSVNSPSIMFNEGHTVIVSIAEKGLDSTWDINPVQDQYRDPNSSEANAMLDNLAAMSNERPIFKYSGQDFTEGFCTLEKDTTDFLVSFLKSASN